MLPGANKQRLRSAVDALWTRLAFMWRCGSKPNAEQSKLKCSWTAARLMWATGNTRRRAGASSTSQRLVFHTPPLELIIFHCGKEAYHCWELWTIEGLLWHVLMNEREKRPFSTNFTVASKDYQWQMIAGPGLDKNFIVGRIKQNEC